MIQPSILKTIKGLIGVVEADHVFDPMIISHINTAIGTLSQLGIGLPQGFEIEDDSATWDSYLGGDKRFNGVKSYIGLRVRLLFDPPTTSFAIDAMTSQIKEFEWRLNAQREDDEWAQPTIPPTESTE